MVGVMFHSTMVHNNTFIFGDSETSVLIAYEMLKSLIESEDFNENLYNSFNDYIRLNNLAMLDDYTEYLGITIDGDNCHLTDYFEYNDIEECEIGHSYDFKLIKSIYDRF